MLKHPSSSRDLRIDFFRGLALISIFWDHIPGNLLGYVTLRNIGFSDAGELFVFLAGYSAAIAYGKQFQRSGYFPTALHILKRAWILYVAHVFLLTQLMAMLLTVNDHVATRDFVAEMGLQYFLDNPKQALVDSTLLGFRPSLMDPLPLYMVLLLMLGAILPLLMRYPLMALLASFVLYFSAAHNNWNFNAQPAKVWYFNPFTWQFLFFIGAVLGMHRDTCSRWLTSFNRQQRRHLIGGVLLFLVVSAITVVSWQWPAWHDKWMPVAMAQWLYPINKTNLDSVRLFHFLAMVLFAALMVPQGRWLRHPLSQVVRTLGRHSLPIFCTGVMLAPLADSINALADDEVSVQCATSVGGVVLLWCLAQLLEWYRTGERQAVAKKESWDDLPIHSVSPER